MFLTLRIDEVVRATPRSCMVRIALDGQSLPYRAGQALMIASHGCDRRRVYSIASAPDDAAREGRIELLIGVDALGSPGSHLELEEGALVDVEGPIGQFMFPDSAEERRFIFIAGGTGIAPLRAMLRQALKNSEAHIELLYSARTTTEFAFDGELALLASEGRIELRRAVTRDIDARNWNGKLGRIGRDDLAPLVNASPALYFVCGPQEMVREIPTILMALGVPADQVRIERWRRAESSDNRRVQD